MLRTANGVDVQSTSCVHRYWIQRIIHWSVVIITYSPENPLSSYVNIQFVLVCICSLYPRSIPYKFHLRSFLDRFSLNTRKCLVFSIHHRPTLPNPIAVNLFSSFGYTPLFPYIYDRKRKWFKLKNIPIYKSHKQKILYFSFQI